MKNEKPLQPFNPETLRNENIKSKTYAITLLKSMESEITAINAVTVFEVLISRIRHTHRKIWFVHYYKSFLAANKLPVDFIQYNQTLLRLEELMKLNRGRKTVTSIKKLCKKRKASTGSFKRKMKNLNVSISSKSTSSAYGQQGNFYKQIPISPKS